MCDGIASRHLILCLGSWSRSPVATLRKVYNHVKSKEIGIPHKTQLSRARVKLDLLLMRLRQCEFSRGVPTFIYLSADASPQGGLEYYIVLEDKISRQNAGGIVEATPEERMQWCKADYLKTTTLPVSVLGSGNASAAAKFEALTHSVILDSMYAGIPANVAKYGESIISYCSDFGAEASIANLPSVCIQEFLKHNVVNSGGLLKMKGDIATDCFDSTYDDDGGIIEDVMIMDDVLVWDPQNAATEPEPKCYFGMLSSLMIPGVKHMFDNVQKELLGVLQYFTTFSDTGQISLCSCFLSSLISVLIYVLIMLD